MIQENFIFHISNKFLITIQSLIKNCQNFNEGKKIKTQAKWNFTEIVKKTLHQLEHK